MLDHPLSPFFSENKTAYLKFSRIQLAIVRTCVYDTGPCGLQFFRFSFILKNGSFNLRKGDNLQKELESPVCFTKQTKIGVKEEHLWIKYPLIHNICETSRFGGSGIKLRIGKVLGTQFALSVS